MVSRSISHYRILKKLGAGGMGEVYLAEDTQLDRKVAVKLLPAGFTQVADRVHRFMQEAKAASALNHTNIITVHDIGQSEPDASSSWNWSRAARCALSSRKAIPLRPR